MPWHRLGVDMPHDDKCEYATTRDCDCDCGGMYHGRGMPGNVRSSNVERTGTPLEYSRRPSRSPVLPSDLSESRSKSEEYLVHNGFTFSEKDANETSIKRHDMLWLDLTEPQKKDVITTLAFRGKAHRAVNNPDDTDRIPIQTAGGRAETRYNRAYEEAPSHGIFDKKGKSEFAERKSKTQAQADTHYKKNVRSWVDAAKDALSSGDKYRIAETAREIPYQEPGTEGITEHLGISQHMAQANVAGQHIEQSIALDDKKRYKEHRDEFASILATIDAQTKNW